MTTSFDEYLRNLEARSNDDERKLLEAAYDRAMAQFDGVLWRIQRRERVDAFVGAAIAKYGAYGVIRHPWPTSALDHDGPCIEIHPRNSTVHFTTLPLKGEVWGRAAFGCRLTDDPIPCDDDDAIFEYIDRTC